MSRDSDGFAFMVIALAIMILMIIAGLVDGQHDEIMESRSPEWRKIRNEFIAEHPTCAACDRKAAQVHHCVPFHVDKTKEVDKENLIALCEDCHIILGHLGNTHAWNPLIREDAAWLLERVKNRPTTEEEAKAYLKKFSRKVGTDGKEETGKADARDNGRPGEGRRDLLPGVEYPKVPQVRGRQKDYWCQGGGGNPFRPAGTTTAHRQALAEALSRADWDQGRH